MTEKRKWEGSSRDKAAIFNKAIEGDKKSILKVIKMFTPMVHMWANRYANMCPEYMYDDLVQEGLLGITKAIETYDPKVKNPSGAPISPSTWVWWKTRAAVQKVVRGNQTLNSILSLDATTSGYGNEAALIYKAGPTVDPAISDTLNVVIDEVCGPEVWPRANIIRDRFGLSGGKAMTQAKVAAKYGVSRQTVCTHISRFIKDVRNKYPELKENLK